jgi:hypothetical protein
MKPQSANSSLSSTSTPATRASAHDDSTRCEHRFAKGARCRLPALNSNPLCHRHAKFDERQQEAADLSYVLTGGLDEFKSPAAINDFLSRLLLLLAQDRISPRRAAVLAYITNQLLRTITAMEQETAAAQDPKKPPVNIIWNLPCPPHEREDLPEQSATLGPNQSQPGIVLGRGSVRIGPG